MNNFIHIACLASILLLSNLTAVAESVVENCGKTTNQAILLICKSQTLLKKDKEMARAYSSSLKKFKSRKLLLEYQQSEWLKERDKCSSESCFIEYYKQRIQSLKYPKIYELIMSKDTKLCNEMDKIFNQTKRVSGNFLSNKYSIAWQNVLGAHWARFDVENDGADELVFKVSSNLNGMSSENLFILPPNSDLLSKFNLLESSGNTSIPKELLDTTNKFDPQEYYLKELPQSFKKAMIDDARKQLPNSIRDKINADYRPVIAGSFVLDPFDFENTIYISLTDLLSNWIVVGKYNQPDEIEDFCYFYNPDTKYH